MRYTFLFILLFSCNLLVSAFNEAEADSVLKNAMNTAEKYSKMFEGYTADVYMRTSIFTLRKNFLYKYTYLIPDFVLYDRKNERGMIETFNSLKYSYPDNYEHRVLDVNGTLTSKKDILMLPYNFLNINVYDIKTSDERFILPIRSETQKYYRYRILSTVNKNDTTYYTFNYSPVYSSAKLLRGMFTIEDKTWRVVHFSGIGNELFVDFKMDMEMGNDSLERFLPVELKIYRTHVYLGNKIQNSYFASLRYNDIELKNDSIIQRNTYNIGNTHKIILDSVVVTSDTTFWKNIRMLTISNNKQKMLDKLIADQLKVASNKSDSVIKKNKTVQLIAQSLITDTKYHYKKTDINYSGFLNPSMLSYSTQDGLNYRIRLSFKTHLIRDKFFSVSTSVGYAFKYNDLVADLSTVFHYHPRRLGELSFSVGKGNRAFSSLFIQGVQDSLTTKGLKFEDMFVNYYKDYYLRIFNNIEIINGVKIGTGVDYHIRQAIERKNPQPYFENDDNLNMRRYFVPTARLTWTPKQYYKREGYEKIYVRSDFPTFKVEYARSFKDIFGSTSQYNRYEFDMNQSVRIGLLQSIQYRLGAGMYTHQQQDEYFADYTFFARYNMPETWGDGIGGVFNLLPYNVYNSSTSYIQAHVMYETPFFIFTLLPKLARGVLSERIYLSQLYTPYIQSYTEIGYGIGNRFVNAAVFASFHKYTFQQIGGKVVFLLGK